MADSNKFFSPKEILPIAQENILAGNFYYLFYLFSPFLWETTQNDPQGLMCR